MALLQWNANFIFGYYSVIEGDVKMTGLTPNIRCLLKYFAELRNGVPEVFCGASESQNSPK